jgi:hypothetical protein
VLRLAALFSTSEQVWLLYDPSVPSTVNTLDTVCQGSIIAIYVDQDVEWSQSPNEPTYNGPLAVGKYIKVANTDGSCLNSRSTPNGEVQNCLPEGFVGKLDDGPAFVDGRWWWRIAGHGWSADPHLTVFEPSQDPPPEKGRIHFYNCTGQGGGYCGLTASGTQVAYGQASCAPSRKGRSFELAGQTFLCTDIGNGVTANDVDIWFPSYEEGLAFMAQLDPNAEVRWLTS